MSARRMLAVSLLGAVALVAPVGAAAGAGAAGGGALRAAASGFGSDWTTYHGNSYSTGVDPAGTDLTPLSAAWDSPDLGGQIYGEPLVEQSRVVVATESDTVYALSAHDGSVLWRATLGTPVPVADVVCGDIEPTIGVTSTPVIDPARDEVFVVADELAAGGVPAHHLVGIDLATGRVELDEVVDPPGSNSAAQLQRAALVLADGQVVMGIGSNAGDCGGPYHGYVVAVPEGGGTPRDFEVDTGTGQLFGSVWMGGAAPLVDAQGNIWVASGNGWATSAGQPYDRSDSVLELSPTLGLEQYFAPSRWAQDNAEDADLGTTAPAFVGGLVFQVGKDRMAYLMDRDHLGGVGGDVASMQLCGTGTGPDYSVSPFGGDAVDGSTVYVPCRDGLTAVAVTQSPPSMRVLWTTPTGSSGGAVVAGGLVWTISQTGMLYGLDPATGAAEVSETIGGVSNHFPTPTVADGLLLVPISTQLLAFDGPAGAPPAPAAAVPSGAYWTVSPQGGVTPAGGAGSYGSPAGGPLSAPLVAAASTPDGRGYWLVAADGGVFAYGDARYLGSMGGTHLRAPIVGIAPTFDGEGYWLVAADGGVFAFGDARYLGSMGGQRLVAPIAGIAATADGRGYRLVARDGGVFAFGDASYRGSMGGRPLVAPVVAIAATAGGGGYWLLGADGGVFSFGDAAYHGSVAGDAPASDPAVSIAPTGDGGGYWIARSGGTVAGLGDAVATAGGAAAIAAVVAAG